MDNITFIPADKLVDDVWGKRGTPQREAMETRVKEEAHAYFLGDAIKSERLKQNLTQEQLGERIGVQRSQICKLESGKCSITLSTMAKVFLALGIPTGSLELGSGQKIPLW